MLSLLRVKNFAVIEELEVELSSGLNVITGETGAGKSVFLRALELIGGKRASTDFIRAGSELAEIEALFHLEEAECEVLRKISDQAEELAADGELLIRRTIDAAGKSKIYLNGRLSTLSILQQIMRPLIDITTQHEQQVLLERAGHRQLLDAFGVDSSLLKKVFDKFQAFSEARTKLEQFEQESATKEAYFSRIRLELEELSAAGLKLGEREQLEQELARAANVEELSQVVQEATLALEESDDNINHRLVRTEQLVEQVLEYDDELKSIFELISSSRVQLQEAALQLQEYQSGLEVEPERLEYLRSRIAEYARLERKYARPAEQLIEYEQAIADELSLLDAGAFDVAALRDEVAKARDELRIVDGLLSAERKKAAVQLEKVIVKELAKLNMRHARFQVKIEDGEPSQHGADRIEFLLAANPGSPLQPLMKVASGGELSRVLLVLKSALSERSGACLQVFDEIDTGIGGAVAHVVGEKLSAISSYSQVLLVTHAPQIAAFAERHFVISKESTKSSAKTTVEVLSEQGRVGEIARMLAGKDVTSKFEQSAKELLGFSRAA